MVQYVPVLLNLGSKAFDSIISSRLQLFLFHQLHKGGGCCKVGHRGNIIPKEEWKTHEYCEVRTYRVRLRYLAIIFFVPSSLRHHLPCAIVFFTPSFSNETSYYHFLHTIVFL